ncbi:DUF4269 domain-containing protein [Gottfriedia solisilvae]|uniref:DUF4269 domain-containing protein n=1 Tax=Gottfriedia solisilvae TaxID=1516104 RepID=UPI003D2F0F3A
MFLSIDYLINGNPRQQKAYHTLSRLNIMEDLREFNPILCGTIPIEIDIKDSDLDIIIEVRDFQYYENLIRNLYGLKYNFKISHSIIRDIPVITVNFNFEEFEIEIFGQATPVQNQNAYIHMVIEHLIMEQFPNIRSEVIHLKEQGYKTEPAFCKILGLEGDPYDSLIEYGKKMFNVK